MSQLSSLPRALSSRRSCSASPWWEPSSDIADAEGGSSSGSRGLDQVLREFRIQKAAPDWLPLLPGGSFWVPPEEIPELKESSGVPAIEPATEGELFAMIMPSGWPAPSTVDGKP